MAIILRQEVDVYATWELAIARRESRGPILKANLNETSAKRRDWFVSHTYKAALEGRGGKRDRYTKKKRGRKSVRETERERERERQKGEERCHQPPKPRQWTVTNCAKFNPRLPGTSLFGMEMSRMQMRVAGEWPSTVITYKDEARLKSRISAPTWTIIHRETNGFEIYTLIFTNILFNLDYWTITCN